MLKGLKRAIAVFTVLCVSAATYLVAAPVVYAAVYTVNRTTDAVNASANGVCDAPGGGCTLREAIMEANAAPGADIIHVPAGTYTLSLTGTEGSNATDILIGDLDITDSLTIVGSGGNREGSPSATIINANGIGRVFTVNTNGATVNLEAIQIQGGLMGPPSVGGGILFRPGSGTNTYTLYNSIVTGNVAAGDGGGIQIGTPSTGNAGNLIVIEKSKISGNHAGSLSAGTPSEAGGLGGGINVGAEVALQIRESEISNNVSRGGTCNPSNCILRTGDGGGIHWWDDMGTPTNPSYVRNSVVSGNQALDSTKNQARGGGWYAGRPLKVTNTSVIGNHANFDGGGLYHSAINGDFHYLANVTISGNTAHNDGAGLIMTPSVGAQLYVVNTTITNNRANADGVGGGVGAGLKINGLDPEVRLHNTIIGRNFKGIGSDASDIEGDNLHASSSHNIVGTGGDVNLVHNINNNQVGMSTEQLGLASLADNGAEVFAAHISARQTHALLGGSVALDAGSNTYVDSGTYGGPYTTDGRGTGWARKLDAGDPGTTDTVDAGALEMHPAIFNITDKTIIQDPPAPLSELFHVGDADLGHDSVTASVSGESMVGLVASAAISGTGHDRTLTVTPGAGKYGTATITTTTTDNYNGTNQSMSDSFVLTVVPRPDLTVTKAPVGSFRQGDQNKSYTLTVTNVGPGTSLQPGNSLLPGVTDITLVDTLPAGLTYDSFTGAGWACSAAGQVVTCTYDPSLAPGANTVLTILVDVADDAGTPVTNQAVVSGGGDNTPGNNTATHLTTIIQTADLTVAKSHMDPWKQGETAKAYTLTVSNIGPGPTDAPFTVTDTLPTGLTYVSATGTNWTCSNAGQNVTCTRSTPLDNGFNSNITLTVNVARDAGTPKVNTAAVSGGGELASRQGNNTASDSTPIVPMPDLTLTKTAVGTFRQGGTGTYRIVVTNSGFAATTGTITVTDTLPTGLTPTGGSGTGWTCNVSEATNTITCETDATLAPSGFTPDLDIAVAISATATTPLLNTAIASGGGEIWTDNSDGDVSTVIVPAPDLTMHKQAVGTFAQGGTGQYTLTVRNAGGGPTDGTAITVSDTLPSDLTPTSATGSGWTCTVTGQSVSCTTSAVVAGQTNFQAITVNVNVAKTAGATLDNTATVSGGGETVTTNNDDTVTTPITQRPDLDIDLTHNDPFHQGQTGATFTVSVTNAGSAGTAGGISVSTTLPAGFTPTAATGTGWSCTITGQTVACSGTDLAAGATTEALTITVAVAGNASDAAVTASVATANDREPGNDDATDSTTVTPMPDLRLDKSEGGTFMQGYPGSYTIDVENVGGAATDGTEVTVTDTLPAGMEPTDAYGTGWDCTITGQTVECTTSAIVAAGDLFEVISIEVLVAPDAAGSATNTATVSGGGEVITSNNTGSVTHDVDPAPDLTIAKVLQGALKQGETGEYRLTVTNTGGWQSFGEVVVEDTLPQGLTPGTVTFDNTVWACTTTDQLVRCTTSDPLDAGQPYPVIAIFVNVAADAPTSLTNTATVSGGGEVNTANNSSTVNSAVEQKADLVIDKAHTGNFHQSQTGATYTLTVTNQGYGDTTGTVTVTDTLPAGLTPTAASGTGWTCTVTGQLVECTTDVVKGQNGVFDPISITVTVAANASDVNNRADVSVSNDVNTGNNFDLDATTVEARPDLTLTKVVGESFREGKANATYILTVRNSGYATTSGTVTVTDTLPTGLTPNGFAGTGWGCDIDAQTYECTTNAAVAAGTNFEALTLTVRVANDAPTSVDNTASVSGGGEVVTTNNTATVTTPIAQAADLTVTKALVGTLAQGDPGQYTIVVRNSGDGPTTGTVTVTDVLASHLTFVSGTGTGWLCVEDPGGTAKCTTSAVVDPDTNFEPITLTVAVANNAPTTLTNTATVEGGGEVETSNNESTVNSTVVQKADLVVDKAHTGNFHQSQAGATYTLTVTNQGYGVTSGTVTVTDTLPAGLTPTAASGTGWTCTVTGQLVECTTDVVKGQNGVFDPITITVTVAANASDVNNRADVSVSNDVNTGNNFDLDPTIVEARPDLTLTKAAVGTFREGEPANYALTVRNSGNATTSGTVTVTDTLPAGLTPNGFSGNGWGCNVSGQTYTCTTNAAVPAQTNFAVLTLNVLVPGGAPTSVDNSAAVSGGGEVVDTNNTAQVTTGIEQAPDLTITKEAVDTFRQGEQEAYTIRVQNIGEGATYGTTVTVTDKLADDLTYQSASGTGWGCGYDSDSRTVTCTTSAVVDPGSYFPDITLTVGVAATALEDLSNTASVSGGGELNSSNNTAKLDLQVDQIPDLRVTKSHDDPFREGQKGATYTITVTNHGTGLTSGTVTVTDTLPAGLTATAISGGTDWTCTLATLTCNTEPDNRLAANDSYDSIVITVDVADDAPDTVTNSVTVAGGNDQVTTNNTYSDDTDITQVANLTVTKSHTGDFRQGQTTGATYTLRVTNEGDGPTVGAVTLSDTVPDGLTPTSVTTTDWDCAIAGQVLGCSTDVELPAGASYPDIVLTVSVSPTAAPTLTNTVTVANADEVITTDNTDSDPTTITQVANLTVTNVPKGTFRQGGTAGFTLTVRNEGTGDTDAPVTLTNTLPAGLTPTAITTDTGVWSCNITGHTVTCTTSQMLTPNSNYPEVEVSVAVAANAAASLTSVATVAGGGEAVLTNNEASATVSVVQVADLTVTKSHHGNMVKGRDGIYTIVVSNTGPGPTDAPVAVVDTLPAPLTAKEINGTGWTCDLGTVTCTRADVLASGGNYPPITLKVSVPANAADSLVTNAVTVSGGGQINLTNDTDTDDTRIVPPAPDVPPQWVFITVPTTLTRESSILVSGVAPANAVVTVNGVGVTANSKGNFSISVALVEGPNTITATFGTASDSKTVVRDTTPPQVSLTAEEMVTDRPTVKVTVQTEADATVEIDQTPGNSRIVQLAMGANQITATATDRAGNIGTATITVVRVPTRIPRTTLEIRDGQPVDWIGPNLRVKLPAGAAPGNLLLILQTPAETPSAGDAELFALIEVILEQDGNPVHNLDQIAELIFTFNQAEVPDSAGLLFFWYDPEGGAWVALDSELCAEGTQLCGKTDHLSLFAVLAPADPVPVVANVPPVSNNRSLALTGTAKAGATVTMVVNGQDQTSATVGQSGRFTLTATLTVGENRIYVRDGDLASAQQIVTFRQPLTDIEGHWAARAINRMNELGIVRGYEDGTFRPENRVTRTEFAIMLARLLKLEQTSDPLPFTDADRIPGWAGPQVAAAVKAGLITGRSDGSFDPNALVTRAEVAIMLSRALQWLGKDATPGNATFVDEAEIPAWALTQVKTAARYGLITGYDDGTFRAGNSTTRAEAVTVLSRLLDLQ